MRGTETPLRSPSATIITHKKEGQSKKVKGKSEEGARVLLTIAFYLLPFVLNRIVFGFGARVEFKAVAVAAVDLVYEFEFFVVLEVDADGVRVLFNV